MKPNISQLSKRISLSPVSQSQAWAYRKTFGNHFARLALIFSMLFVSWILVQACFGLPVSEITVIIVSIATFPAVGLSLNYVITLLVFLFRVVRTEERALIATSAGAIYTGHCSVLLELLEREALALGETGRSIRFLKTDGKPYYILRMTTYAPYMGYRGAPGFPRRIYFVIDNAGDNTWEVRSIEHLLFWNRGRRIISTRPEAELKQWIIPQWLTRVVAIANMKEKRFLSGE